MNIWPNWKMDDNLISDIVKILWSTIFRVMKVTLRINNSGNGQMIPLRIKSALEKIVPFISKISISILACFLPNIWADFENTLSWNAELVSVVKWILVKIAIVGNSFLPVCWKYLTQSKRRKISPTVVFLVVRLLRMIRGSTSSYK